MSNLMTHIVAGYPSKDEALELLVGMDLLGVEYVEIQIPFTDPSADGPTIMRANDIALEQGTTISDVFDLVTEARKRGVKAQIFIMSYVNKLAHTGIEQLVEMAAEAGVNGFIIPDLPLNSEEYEQFVSAASEKDLSYIPVVSPGMDSGRLASYLDSAGELVYLTSTHGITGKDLQLDDRLQKVITEIKAHSDKKIAMGFGIRTPEDVRAATSMVDIAVVGSAVIDKIDQSSVTKALSLVSQLLEASE